MLFKVLKSFLYMDETGKMKCPKVDSIVELNESDAASLLKRKSIIYVEPEKTAQTPTKTKRVK